MITAITACRNPRQIVIHGYDRIGDAYRRFVASGDQSIRNKYLTLLEQRVPPGARVLDLGCGPGLALQRLSSRYRVVGLDISTAQLSLARQATPSAILVCGDLAGLPFGDATFDAAIAFYSITHVPRAEHRYVLREVCRVLRPGGQFIATMGFGSLRDSVEESWLGVPMFFSHFAGPYNVVMIAHAGFTVEQSSAETELEHGKQVAFRWIVAQRS